VAADGGGYVDLDSDGHWWIPSGRIYYALAPATPLQEETEALAHFFLPRRFEDPFGNATSVDYDIHDLLVVKTTDAVKPVGNTCHRSERLSGTRAFSYDRSQPQSGRGELRCSGDGGRDRCHG
jgi:hypothetical protein